MTKQDALKSFLDWIVVKSDGNIHYDRLYEAAASEIVDDVFDSYSDGQPIVDILSDDEINRLIFQRWKSHLLLLLSNCEEAGGAARLYRGCKLNYPLEYQEMLRHELDQLEIECSK